MKKLLLIIAVLLGCIAMSAQPRSEQQAKQIASEFFKKKPLQKAPMLSVVPQQKVSQTINKKMARSKASPAQHSAYYIINDDANNRFVIVSSDERLYEILGYSDNGCFDAEKAPVALIELIDGYDHEYSALLNSGYTESISSEYETVDSIPYFVKSTWGQDEPYNLHCPLDIKGRHSVTGCVATAMAQTMNYYHYPNQTKGGTIRYKAPSLGCYESFDYSTYSINWNNIEDTYNESCTETQKQEVAKLMHACGVSVYMDYDSISNANSYNIPYALIKNFGFNANTYFVDRDYYDIKEWHKMMRKELKAKRPILYGGHGMGGHRFIIDGINTQGLYHINFGWDGDCDGWFSIDAIHPYGDFYALFLNAHFNNDQSMVIGVSKETIDESHDVFYVDKIKLDTLSHINTNTSISCDEDSYYFCYGNKVNSQISDTYTIGVGVFDENWQLLKSLDRYTYSFKFGLGIKRNFSVKYDAATFTEGSQYYIALYAQHKYSSKPTIIRTQYGKQDWYRATTKDGQVYLERKRLIDTISVIPPRPVIPEGPVGDYVVYASDRSGNGVTWQVVCIKDTEDSTKYYIKGLDPTLSKEAVSNTVHGL